jgi:uncharacterized protein
MGGDYIENYAVKLFEEWGIGMKQKDNGVLLVVSMDEKILRIEVGYGLEGALPDSVASSIITGVMIPRLKEGNPEQAIADGVQSIMEATKGEYVAKENLLSSFPSFDALFAGGFVVLLILQWLAAIFARSESFWAGGIVGAIVGVAVSSIFSWWLLLGFGITVLLGTIGLGFDYIVSHAYAGAKRSGGSIPWYAGGGSGSSGSGGGFGGFGGGSSGGGGASGSW